MGKIKFTPRLVFYYYYFANYIAVDAKLMFNVTPNVSSAPLAPMMLTSSFPDIRKAEALFIIYLGSSLV
jgi:hypothetical protein